VTDRQRCIFNVRASNLGLDEEAAVTGITPRRFYVAMRLRDRSLVLGRSKRRPRLSPERYRLMEW
jgi:hypothetical protein